MVFAESSAPKPIPIADYQFDLVEQGSSRVRDVANGFRSRACPEQSAVQRHRRSRDLGFTLPVDIYPHLVGASKTHFENGRSLLDENGTVLDLIARSSLIHNERKNNLIRWISDLSVAAPGLIFAAGPMTVNEGSLHIVSISTNEEMREAVQSGLSCKPKGSWVYHTTLTTSTSGIIPLTSLSIPLWLRGILAGEHIYMNRDRESGFILKKLRDESRQMLEGAPEIILAELALFDVYRSIFKRMPTLTNLSCLFLRSELEQKGLTPNEILAESDIQLGRRNVLPKFREQAINYLAAFHGIKRRKKATPPPLPFGRKLKICNGK